MSIDLTRIGVEVDTSGLEKGEGALDRFTRSGKTAERGMLKLRTSARRMDGQIRMSAREIDKFGKTTQRVGAGLSMYLTLPLVAAGAAIGRTSMKFETEMTKINTLVGISTSELAAMETQMFEISKMSGRGPTELAQALFTVTSAGARGTEAMQVLETASKASAIGLGETQSVAKATTAVIQAYGSENITAARATDILASTIRAGNLEAASLAPVLGRAIGIAAELGISFEELGANVATFTRLGVSAEEAITGIRGVMNALIKPSSEGVEALASVGMTFEDLRKQVATQGLAATMRGLLETFDGQTDALSKVIPSVEALSNVLGTAGAQGEAYSQILDDISNGHGIVEEGFATVGETAEMQWNQAKVAVETAMLSFRNEAIPMVKELAMAVKEGAEFLGGLDEQTRRNVVRFGLFAAAAGPVLGIFGRMISVLPRVIKLFGMLRLAMMTTPWGAAATVAGGLAALLAGKYVTSAGDAVEATNDFTEALVKQNETLQESQKHLDNMNIQTMMSSTQNAIDATRQEVEKLRQAEEDYQDALSKYSPQMALRSVPDFKGFGEAEEAQKLLDQLLKQRDAIAELNTLENRLKQSRANSGTVAQSRIPGLEQEIDLIRQSIGLTAKYTKAVEDSNAAVEDANATREKITVPDNLFDTFEQAEQAIRPMQLLDQYMLGLPVSINQAETAMRMLEDALKDVGTDAERERIRKMVEQLDEMMEVMNGATIDEGVSMDLAEIKKILDGYPSSLRTAEKALQDLNEAMETTADPEKREDLRDYILELEKVIDKMRGIENQTQKTNKIAQELGFTFSSAAEDAIVSWTNFADLLQGIFDDILRITTRVLVTKPLSDALTGALSGVPFGGGSQASVDRNYSNPNAGVWGGGRAAGGPVDYGKYYLVGEEGPELFAPTRSGMIIPNDEVEPDYLKKAKKVNDALIRNDGSVVEFDKDDDILAMKDFNNLIDKDRLLKGIIDTLSRADLTGGTQPASGTSRKLIDDVQRPDTSGSITYNIRNRITNTSGSGGPRSSGLRPTTGGSAGNRSFSGPTEIATFDRLVEKTDSVIQNITKNRDARSWVTNQSRTQMEPERNQPLYIPKKDDRPTQSGGNVYVNVENYTDSEIDIQQRETARGIQITAVVKEAVVGLMNTGKLDRPMRDNYSIQRKSIRRG